MFDKASASVSESVFAVFEHADQTLKQADISIKHSEALQQHETSTRLKEHGI